MTTVDQDRDDLRRRALGWSVACPRIDQIDHGRDLALAVGDRGRDLAQLSGIDCLGQSLTIALTTMAGSDPFNTEFGFDGLRALAEETNQVIARERIRVSVIQVLRRDPRIRRINDVRFGGRGLATGADDIERPDEPPDPVGTLSVRVGFETMTGDPVTVDLGGFRAVAETTELEAIATVLDIDDRVVRSSGGEAFGITRTGFVPKPFARLLAEKLALARAMYGPDLDLGSGSAIRKLLEISALEDARGWAALTSMYDDAFVATAAGDALSRLGEELGLARPMLEARGRVKVTLQAALPGTRTSLTLPRGARLSTPGGHHAALEETVVLTPGTPERTVPVVACFPGPDHNLDPSAADAGGAFPQKLDRWNRASAHLGELVAAEREANQPLVAIAHTEPLRGGELGWPDARYRQLLLVAPRSVWTVEAVETAISLVPGVRQVQVRDAWGGLDINQSIFGNFNFIERLFGSERDLGTPYYFNVLVAPTPAAIWDGPTGLHVAVESAIEDLRPISIFPRIVEGSVVSVGVQAKVVLRGIPLPTGSRATVNASQAAGQVKARLVARLRQYVDSLRFGEPVRAAQVHWAMLNEPGVADVQDLQLLRFPAHFETLGAAPGDPVGLQAMACGVNLPLGTNEIPVLVEDPDRLVIV